MPIISLNLRAGDGVKCNCNKYEKYFGMILVWVYQYLFVIVKSFKNMLRAVTNDGAKLLEITFLFLYLAIVRLMCNGLHQQNFC